VKGSVRQSTILLQESAEFGIGIASESWRAHYELNYAEAVYQAEAEIENPLPMTFAFAKHCQLSDRPFDLRRAVPEQQR